MKRYLTTALAATLLLAHSTVCGAESLWVVSTREQPMIARPCVVYEVDEQGTIKQFAEISARDGIRAVKVWQEARAIAVWRYTARYTEVTPNGKGEVCLLLPNQSAQERVLPLPYCPVLGGFFALLSQESESIITEGVSGNAPVLWRYSVGESEALPFEEVPWQDIVTDGGTYWSANRRVGIGGIVDPETGSLFRVLGLREAKMTLALPPNEIDLLKSTAQSQDSKMAYGILVNDQRHTVLGYHYDVGSGLMRRLIVLDKSSLKWHAFVVPGSVGNLSQFGHWLVFQQCLEEVDGSALISGKDCSSSIYRFYDYDGRQHGEWHADNGEELLLMQASKVLFRRADAILSASFRDGVIQDEKLIGEQPDFADIHWAVADEDWGK